MSRRTSDDLSNSVEIENDKSAAKKDKSEDSVKFIDKEAFLEMLSSKLVAKFTETLTHRFGEIMAERRRAAAVARVAEARSNVVLLEAKRKALRRKMDKSAEITHELTMSVREEFVKEFQDAIDTN